jgi:hypothetical protein
MEDTTQEEIQPPEPLDPDRPRKGIKNRRAYKQKPEYKPKKKPKYIVDPTDNRTQAIPQVLLDKDATNNQLITRVNQLQKVVQIQSAVIEDVRLWFRSKRQEKEVDTTAVALLAARGNSKHTIATLLGFDLDAFNKRKELQQAFDIGLAEISDALSTKQLNTAFNERGMPATTMQIFLGKVLLGQRDGSGGQGAVNVQINNQASGGALREKIRAAREVAVRGKQEFDNVVTEIDTEIVEGTVVAVVDDGLKKV